jgi:hypothetical protein
MDAIITTTTDAAASNSLADLAARIRAEHEACGTALRRGLEHAIAAGELLIQAKDQLAHGQWLPWLREHCQIPERTAQLYMRLARHLPEIRNVADSTLTEAVSLIAKPTVAEAISDAEPGPAGQLERAPWHEIFWRFRLELAAIDPRIEITPTGLKLPDDLPYDKWKIVGALLDAFFRPFYAIVEARS